MKGRISKQLASVLRNPDAREQLLNFLIDDESSAVITLNSEKLNVKKVVAIPGPVDESKQKEENEEHKS